MTTHNTTTLIFKNKDRYEKIKNILLTSGDVNLCNVIMTPLSYRMNTQGFTDNRDIMKNIADVIHRYYPEKTDAIKKTLTSIPLSESDKHNYGDLTYGDWFNSDIKDLKDSVHGILPSYNQMQNKTKNEITEYMNYLESLINHGHLTWFDWNIENWGTKWNAYETKCYEKMHLDQTIYVIEFQTAWSEPKPALKTLSIKADTELYVFGYREEAVQYGDYDDITDIYQKFEKPRIEFNEKTTRLYSIKKGIITNIELDNKNQKNIRNIIGLD